MPQWDEIIQDPMIVGIAGAVLIVIVVALILVARRRRRRRDSLQRRFGAEYERTVREGQSRKRAEADLEARREQRDKLELRPLKADERDRFRARFEEFQTSFVDAPADALRSVDNLIDEVAAARGYEPVEGTSRMGLVSVDHAEEVAAHQRGLSNLSASGQTKTEDLRQALLNARNLLERLVSEGEAAEADAAPPPRTLLGLGEEKDEDVGDLHGGEHDRGTMADRTSEPSGGRGGRDEGRERDERSGHDADDVVDERHEGDRRDEGDERRESHFRDEGDEPQEDDLRDDRHDRDRRDRGADLRDDRTLSSQADEDGHVVRTVDLTAEERSVERG